MKTVSFLLLRQQTSTLSVGSWLLLLGRFNSKVRMRVNTTKKKQKKRKKPRLLSLLFASEDVCLGGANFVDERAGLIKKKFKMCLVASVFFSSLSRRTFCALLLCVSANRISNTHTIRIRIHA